MAISSSSCRVLNSPVVTMVIRVLNPNGEVFERAFEMSLDQFHVSFSLCIYLKTSSSSSRRRLFRIRNRMKAFTEITISKIDAL